VSPDSIQAILQDKQIAIVHPVTSLRPLFLSYFIDSTSSGLVYHRMTAEASSVMGWVGRLLDDIAGLNGAVGQQTRGLLQAQADPAAVAVSLARELGALNPDGVLLYLDDVDAVELGDGFAAFMRTLIGELPPHVRMVVSSRVLPRAPWQEFVKGGKAAVLGLENRRNNLSESRN
jgi:ATP/maltotriose-dependent transcriptional regulator MalT